MQSQNYTDEAQTEIRTVVIRQEGPDGRYYYVDLLCPRCHRDPSKRGLVSRWHPGRSAAADPATRTSLRRCPHPLSGCPRPVRFSYIGVRPFIAFGSDPGEPGGADVDVVRHLSTVLRFRAAFSPARSHGVVDPSTGEWTGMTRAVALGEEADAGVGGASLIYTRWRVVHFSEPTHGVEYIYVAVPPRPKDPLGNIVKVIGRVSETNSESFGDART